MLFHKFVVIGAGQTGLNVAQRLASSGQDVLLVESNDLGGSYIFSSDLPKETVKYEASKIAHIKTHMGEEVIDIKKVPAKLKNLVKSKVSLNYKQIKKDLKKIENLEIVYGTAEFSTKNLILIKANNGEKITVAFEHSLICTGKGEMSINYLDGLDKVPFLHQHNSFFGDIYPTKLAILGANKENLEVAEIFSNLGSEVVVFEEEPPEKLFFQHDTTSVNYLLQNLLRKGMEFYFSINLTKIAQNAQTKEIVLTDSDDNLYEFSHVYSPVIEKFQDNMNLEEIGIKYSDKGVYCTSTGQTTQKNIWVFGGSSNSFKKVNTNQQLHNFVERFAALKQSSEVSKSRSLAILSSNTSGSVSTDISDLTFNFEKVDIDKPIATIGHPYKQAISKYGPVVKFDLLFNDEMEGFLKIIYNDQNKQLLGLVVVGEICKEMYYTCIDFMNKNSSLKDFQNLVFNLGFRK